MANFLLVASLIFEGCFSFPSPKSGSETDERGSYSVSGGLGCCPEGDPVCEQSEEMESWPYEGIWYVKEENGRHKFNTINTCKPITYYCRDYYDPRIHLNSSLSREKGRQVNALPKEYPSADDCFFTRSARGCILEASDASFSEETIVLQGQLLACPQGEEEPFIVYPENEGESQKYLCQNVSQPSKEYKQGLREEAMTSSRL